jgi:N-formylglutamate amidohydrolase
MDASAPLRARTPEPHTGADALEPPFLLVEPLRRKSPLLLASPHSGRRYPRALLDGAKASLAALRRAEDAYVDALFAQAPQSGAALLCATVARAFLDLNRDPSELDPGMFEGCLSPLPVRAKSPRVQAGLGVIPRLAGDGGEIYAGKLAASEAGRRLSSVHEPYHAALTAQMEENFVQFGCAVLLDCHSMPSCARGPFAPDIVLGDRFGAAAAPELINRAEHALKRLGYRVARNTPFAGGYGAERYGRPEKGWHAIQIELSRSLYLNERTLEPNANFDQVRRDMQRLIEALVEAKLEKRLR